MRRPKQLQLQGLDSGSWFKGKVCPGRRGMMWLVTMHPECGNGKLWLLVITGIYLLCFNLGPWDGKKVGPTPSAILSGVYLTNTPESMLHQCPIQVDVGTLVTTLFMTLNKQGGHDVCIRKVGICIRWVLAKDSGWWGENKSILGRPKAWGREAETYEEGRLAGKELHRDKQQLG